MQKKALKKGSLKNAQIVQNSIGAVHYVADFAKPLRKFFALSLQCSARISRGRAGKVRRRRNIRQKGIRKQAQT